MDIVFHEAKRQLRLAIMWFGYVATEHGRGDFTVPLVGDDSVDYKIKPSRDWIFKCAKEQGYSLSALGSEHLTDEAMPLADAIRLGHCSVRDRISWVSHVGHVLSGQHRDLFSIGTPYLAAEAVRWLLHYHYIVPPANHEEDATKRVWEILERSASSADVGVGGTSYEIHELVRELESKWTEVYDIEQNIKFEDFSDRNTWEEMCNDLHIQSGSRLEGGLV